MGFGKVIQCYHSLYFLNPTIINKVIGTHLTLNMAFSTFVQFDFQYSVNSVSNVL